MSVIALTPAAVERKKPTAKALASELVRGRGPFNYTRFIAVENVDLKRDRSKRRWVIGQGISERVRGMWFAMPPEVWSHKDAAAAVPAECGVIVVDINADTYSGACRIERPCKRQPARKLDAREQLQLARLGVMRYWSRSRAA